MPKIGQPDFVPKFTRSPLHRVLLRWPACTLLGTLPGAAWPAWALEPVYRFSPAAFCITLASLAALSWLAFLHGVTRDPRRGSRWTAEGPDPVGAESGSGSTVGYPLGMAAMDLFALARRNARFALAVLPVALALRLARAESLDLATAGPVADGSRSSRVSLLELDPHVLAAIAIGVALLLLVRCREASLLELLPLALIAGLIAWAPLGSWAADLAWPEPGSAAWLVVWPFSAPGLVGTGPGAWAGLGGLVWAAWLELLARSRHPLGGGFEPQPKPH